MSQTQATDTDLVAIIPARAGSKGIPGKNKRKLGGTPLFEISVRQALESNIFSTVVVSTDDKEILDRSRELGITVILRPEEISGDLSPSSLLIRHALKEIAVSEGIVVLLEPTSPLRRKGLIESATRLFQRNVLSFDTAISVSPAIESHPANLLKISQDGGLIPMFPSLEIGARRQSLEKVWYPDGTLYMARIEHYLSVMSFYKGNVMPLFSSPEEKFELDDELDWSVVSRIYNDIQEQ